LVATGCSLSAAAAIIASASEDAAAIRWIIGAIFVFDLVLGAATFIRLASREPGVITIFWNSYRSAIVVRLREILRLGQGWCALC